MITLALEYDGALAVDGQLVPEVGEALRALKAAGVRLVLWSCRCNPCDDAPPLVDEENRFWAYGEVPARARAHWVWFADMRAALKAGGLWPLFDLVWQAPGKPDADLYLAPGGERVNWPAIVATFTGGVTP